MMGMSYAFHRLVTPPETSPWRIAAASVVVTLTALKISQFILKSRNLKVIPSARTTLLPTISKEAAAALPYPPDALPNGRYVDSPYGTIRVYEWGPEQGRKVLFVHGITTPCIALGAVAQGLVDRGCRVMLFDLWGRGYSDAPADLPYDARLYCTEILIALTSSSLSWTGSSSSTNELSQGFDLVGYSLGGGIATAFASHFPSLVRTLTLLAPSGLIRRQHMSSRSTILYSTGLVPEPLLLWLVKKRLLAGPMYAKENKEAPVFDAEDLGAAEADDDADLETTVVPLSRTRPDIHVQQAVQWQLRNHDGFVKAFMSSIRHAPITEQQDLWHRLRDVRQDKILLIAGTHDPIVFPDEIREDAESHLGEDRVEYRELDSTHDFPVTDSRDVVKAIFRFWDGSA